MSTPGNKPPIQDPPEYPVNGFPSSPIRESAKSLTDDVESLRIKFPKTADLYRELCSLLFFKYSENPTAARLYSLVRKGSNSVPTAAVQAFWEHMREMTKTKIEHPDLPDDIRILAGDLIAKLWIESIGTAKEGLSSYVREAQSSVVEATNRCQSAISEQNRLTEQLEESSAALKATLEKTTALELDLAAARAAIGTMEAESTRMELARTALHSQLEESRQEFSRELSLLKVAAEESKNAFRESERRALLEIDRERTAASKFQKQLEVERDDAKKTASEHRSEVSDLQNQIGDMRQKLGSMEGTLIASGAIIANLSNDLKESAQMLSETRTDIARSEEKLANSTEKYEALLSDYNSLKINYKDLQGQLSSMESDLNEARQAKKGTKK